MTLRENPSETPQELLGIEALVDRLARAEAASMARDLPDRIVASTRVPARVVVREGVIGRVRGGAWSQWRVAASLAALLGTAGVAGWLATRAPVTPSAVASASPDAALASDVWSAVDSAWEDEAWARTTSALREVDALRASIESIGGESWSATDVVDAEWLRDAM